MPDTPLFCSKCGAEAASGAGFCERCGASLAVASPPVAAPPLAAAPPAVAYAQQPQYPPGYFGGFWIRVAAQLIDWFILGIPLGIVAALLFAPIFIRISNGDRMEEGPPPEMIGLVFLFYPIAIGCRWLYEALMTS